MKFGASSFVGSVDDISKYVQCIELYIPRMKLYNNRILDKEELKTIKDHLSTTDLLTSMHAPYYSEDEKYPQDLRIDTANMIEKDFLIMQELFQIASDLGTETIVIHPGLINDNRLKSFNSMIKNLKILADMAENFGVIIGLENKEGTSNNNFCCEAKELVETISEINSENLKATFDIGHANLTCKGDMKKLKQFISTLAPHIIHIHVHDNEGKWTSIHNGDQHLAPGKGIIDYTLLKLIENYNGIYNMEVSSIDDIIFGKSTILKALDYY